jgi:uncharacterized protein (TIRG00374 family)
MGLISKRQAGMGVIIWLLIFGAFVALAGFKDFATTITQITPTEFGVILVAVAIGVLAMGSSLYVISRNLDIGITWLEAVFLNTSVSLAHNLTPFGQAGGAPIGAVVLAERSGSPYEECLAAISMKDMVSFVPTLLIFSVGGPYLVFFEESLPDRLRPMFAFFSLLVFVVVLLILGVRTYPDVIRALLQKLVKIMNRTVARLPVIPSLDESEVEARVENFSDSIGTVASHKPTMIAAITLATTSFVAQGILLWLALQAVGVEVPMILAVFIVPVSLFAAGLPLPGGSGGVEALQILILGATAAAATTPTITAVVLSRGLVYWTPIVLGSLTLIVFQLDETVNKA